MAGAHRILVRVDGSLESDAALAWTKQRALKRGSSVIVLATTRTDDSYEKAEAERRRLSESLEQHAADLRAHGIAQEMHFVEPAPSALVSAAIERQASRIVLPDSGSSLIPRVRSTLRARALSRRVARTVITVPARWPDVPERWHTVCGESLP